MIKIRRREIIGFVARILAGTYLVLFFTLYSYQEKLIFFPRKLDPARKFVFRLPYEERYFTVDGMKLHSLFFRVENPRGLLLYFHGNSGSNLDWGELAQIMAEISSYNVWIFDYPGFGKSEGEITSEEQLHRISREFLFLAQEEKARKLILYGRSVGSGLAVRQAVDNKVDALILESPYLSFQSVVTSISPFAHFFLLRYTFRSDQWIPSVESPIAIFHGEKDEVFSVKEARKLASLNPRAEIFTIPNAIHNDLADFREYRIQIMKFLDKVSESP